jgi:hypothetical protein
VSSLIRLITQDLGKKPKGAPLCTISTQVQKNLNTAIEFVTAALIIVLQLLDLPTSKSCSTVNLVNSQPWILIRPSVMYSRLAVLEASLVAEPLPLEGRALHR